MGKASLERNIRKKLYCKFICGTYVKNNRKRKVHVVEDPTGKAPKRVHPMNTNNGMKIDT